MISILFAKQEQKRLQQQQQQHQQSSSSDGNRSKQHCSSPAVAAAIWVGGLISPKWPRFISHPLAAAPYHRLATISLVLYRQAGHGPLPHPQGPPLTSPRTMHRRVTPGRERDPSSRSCVAHILADVTERSHDNGVPLGSIPRRQVLLVSPALCPNPRGRSRSVHPGHGCGRQLPPEGEDGVPPPQRIYAS